MQQPLPNYQQPQQSFVREYWYVFAGGVVFLLLGFAYVLRALTPRTIPIQDNSWNNVTPGYSTLQEVEEHFGPSLGSYSTELGTVHEYKSEYPYLPHQVVTSRDGTVQFMKELLSFDENHKLDQYVSKYGQPDLELFVPQVSGAVRAHVFLKTGLVVIAHVQGGYVEQKWYFTPTTQENFLRSWGNKLSDEEEGPEPIEVQ